MSKFGDQLGGIETRSMAYLDPFFLCRKFPLKQRSVTYASRTNKDNLYALPYPKI